MKGNVQEKEHGVTENVIYLLGMMYRHYKIVFVFIILEMLCAGLIPLFGIYLPKLSLQLVMENQGLRQAIMSLGVFCIFYILLHCISSISSSGKYPFQNNIRMVYTRLLFYKALDCDYSIMETSEGQTWYQKARSAVNNGDGSATSKMFNAITQLISGLIAFAFIFGIISGLSVYIVVLLTVLSAVNYYLDSYALRYEIKQRDKVTELRKKHSYMERTMADINSAKDIRIYNLSSLFIGIREILLNQMYVIYSKIQNRYFLSKSIKLLIIVIRDGIAYAYCIWQVIQGSISVPEFVLYMSAVASFSNWMNGIISNIFTLKQENTRLNDLRAFYDYTNKLDPKNPLPISVITEPIEIIFKNVSFQYTDITPKILDSLSFHVHANEKVALVGVNGAGKTTIVKLLCGFYKVNEGEILINGYNINSFKRTDLYTLFSAVFQDICILPVTAGENITLKKADTNTEERLIRCLEIAGVKDVIMRHSKKLNASMLKIVDEDGIILSGGEQQKLLLARALYKDAPLLLLDEPTAALDPIAESEVYEKFHEVTKNKTAVYISHRLASTRFCDRILMLKDGRIIESGSHEELMSQKSEYAYMFEIQSHYYKQGEGEAV